jgi:hypothetical protein
MAPVITLAPGAKIPSDNTAVENKNYNAGKLHLNTLKGSAVASII